MVVAGAAVAAIAIAVPALAGSGPSADSSASAKKIAEQAKKKAKRALKKAENNEKAIEGIPAGEQGPQGLPGVPGVNASENVVARSATGNSLQKATCNSGERVIGGGALATSLTDSLAINSPDKSAGLPTEWHARTSSGGSVTAIALCGSP